MTLCQWAQASVNIDIICWVCGDVHGEYLVNNDATEI